MKEILSGQLGSNSVLTHALDELTLQIDPSNVLMMAEWLSQTPELAFKQLIDLTAVDYYHYGAMEWTTDQATRKGFCRGVKREELEEVATWDKPRFAVVYHLLSIEHNIRLRVKAFLPENNLKLASVVPVWPVANWFEREVFDLFGILFEGHPDLRRILTDYGFIGHPFRKDFPLSGEVEVRYDATQGRVVYEPVDIEPRTLVPKTIRASSEGTDA